MPVCYVILSVCVPVNLALFIALLVSRKEERKGERMRMAGDSPANDTNGKGERYSKHMQPVQVSAGYKITVECCYQFLCAPFNIRSILPCSK